MLLQPVRDLVVALFPQAVSARGLVRHSALLCLRGHLQVVALSLLVVSVKGMAHLCLRGHHQVVALFPQVVSVKGMAHRTRTRV